MRGDGGHAACTVQSAAARLLHLLHRPQKVKNKPLDYWQKLERFYIIGRVVSGQPYTLEYNEVKKQSFRKELKLFLVLSLGGKHVTQIIP